MNAQKIRQQIAKLFASDRPKWEKWENLAEVVQYARRLTDSLLSEGHDFDHLDDALAIAIYDDRTQTAWPPPPHRCSVARCLLREDMMNCALPCWRAAWGHVILIVPALSALPGANAIPDQPSPEERLRDWAAGQPPTQSEPMFPPEVTNAMLGFGAVLILTFGGRLLLSGTSSSPSSSSSYPAPVAAPVNDNASQLRRQAELGNK